MRHVICEKTGRYYYLNIVNRYLFICNYFSSVSFDQTDGVNRESHFAMLRSGFRHSVMFDLNRFGDIAVFFRIVPIVHTPAEHCGPTSPVLSSAAQSSILRFHYSAVDI